MPVPVVQLQFTGRYPSGCSIECCCPFGPGALLPASSSSSSTTTTTTVAISTAGDEDDEDDDKASCSFGPSLVALATLAKTTGSGGGAVILVVIIAAASGRCCCKSSKVTSLLGTGEEEEEEEEEGEAPAAACSSCPLAVAEVELELELELERAPTHELTSSSLTSRSRTFASRLETLFSNAVTRSSVASACTASEEAGAACGWVVPVIVVVVEVSSGEWTLLGLDVGMAMGTGVVVAGARGPVTSVPDIVVSAVLAASPLGA